MLVLSLLKNFKLCYGNSSPPKIFILWAAEAQNTNKKKIKKSCLYLYCFV